MSNRVLIIEDETTTAEFVCKALLREGIQSDIAKDGEDGISKFKENSYEVVVLDLRMPKKNGEEVLVEIRKIDPFVDVIVYTNYKEFIDLKHLTNIGIDGYVNKGPSAELDELIAIIKEKLEPYDVEEMEKLVKNTPKELFECNEEDK
jgi:DNA-binding response OmpR family regulator